MSALRLSPAVAAWAQLAAELVNTRPRETDPPEKLVGVAEAEALLARCPEPAPAVASADVEALRGVRAELVAPFEARTEAVFADVVNPLLGRATGGWEMAAVAGGGWALEPATGASVADWFGARSARGLAELVLAYGLDRLHMCAADDCLCAVVDVSRNGARRYCSRTCANRMSSRRHRQAR
jgi:predicted RNA-binding Zn ribbon-like protein